MHVAVRTGAAPQDCWHGTGHRTCGKERDDRGEREELLTVGEVIGDQCQRAVAGTAAPDLRGPEWEVFTAPDPPEPSDDFTIRRDPAGVPPPLTGFLTDVVQAERLREVRALAGFTRLDAPDLATWAPLSRDRPRAPASAEPSRVPRSPPEAGTHPRGRVDLCVSVVCGLEEQVVADQAGSPMGRRKVRPIRVMNRRRTLRALIPESSQLVPNRSRALCITGGHPSGDRLCRCSRHGRTRWRCPAPRDLGGG